MRLTSTKSPTVLRPARMPTTHMRIDADQADGENQRLAGVEHGERDIGSHAQPLVARHRLVVADRLALLGAEILHRFEIQQAVDRLGVGVGVALVHRAADRDAPVGRHRREDHVDDDHHRITAT